MENYITIYTLAMILQLGSPHYQMREAAQVQLRRLLPVAGPYLAHSRNHNNPEIAARSERLYNEWCLEMSTCMRPFDWPQQAWIDGLPEADNKHRTVRYYLRQVGWTTSNHEPTEWPKYQQATTIYIRDCLMNGMEVNEAQTLLNRMADTDARWIVDNHSFYEFPDHMLNAARKRLSSLPLSPD